MKLTLKLPDFLLLILALTVALPIYAQRETDNWYFGQNASLEFNAAGVPVSFANSAMVTPAGAASISDKAGNLLFYTNSETVWNRLHQPMANGTGLDGWKLATQPCIIIPKPGSNSLYYIITQEPVTSGPSGLELKNLRYSVVDISANNGLGEVIQNSKNILFYSAPANTGLSEKLTAVHHANHQDIWLITHRFANANTHDFLSFKVTNAGIQPVPVSSQFPAAASLSSSVYGGLKVAPTGNWLAGHFHGNNFLFKFNNITGSVSSPVSLYPVTVVNHQIEFSPDGTKLYTVPSTNIIDQFDLSSGVDATIIGSKTTIAQTGMLNAYVSLQLASNGKIYVGFNGSRNIGEIEKPDVAGTACSYRARLTLASSTNSGRGFPNFIQSYFAPPRFIYTGVCAGNPVSFSIPNQSGIDSVSWNFDDPATGPKNVSQSLQPAHLFSGPGIFYVTLKIYRNGLESVFERGVAVKPTPFVNIGRDTTICEGQVLQLRNKYPLSPFNERFLWSTGDTTATIKTSGAGIYWLQLNNGSCTYTDTILITVKPQPTVNLGGDKMLCSNKPYILNATSPLAGATYLWSPGGEKTPTLTVTKSGTYAVVVNVNGCQASSQAEIIFNPITSVDLGPDIVVCEGEPVILKTIEPTASTFYVWSDGTRNRSQLKPTKSGTYWVQVIQDGCVVTDTVNITFLSCPPPPVPVIPNIITPNNDGTNDKFVLKEIPEGEWNLKLFNRWGMEIYQQKGYKNDWPQQPVNDGTYYYFLEDPKTGRSWKGWLEVVH